MQLSGLLLLHGVMGLHTASCVPCVRTQSHSIVRDRSCHTTLLHSQVIDHVTGILCSDQSLETTVPLCQVTEQEKK